MFVIQAMVLFVEIDGHKKSEVLDSAKTICSTKKHLLACTYQIALNHGGEKRTDFFRNLHLFSFKFTICLFCSSH